MSLGDELRKARMARKLTASEVAAKTRMKVQLVEAIEEEDFSKIAAPIYAKGFIRLFAEAVGLNSAPLVQEYTDRFLHGSSGPGVGPSILKNLQGPEIDDDENGIASDDVGDEIEAAGDKGKVQVPDMSPVESAPSVKKKPLAAEDDDEDLFTRIVDRNEEKHFQQADEAEDSLPQLREFLKTAKEKFLKEVIEPCGELWRRGKESASVGVKKAGAAVRDKSKAIGAGVRDQFGKFPARMAIVALASVIIILVLSSLINFGKSTGSKEASAKGAGVFKVAVEPSDPYLD